MTKSKFGIFKLFLILLIKILKLKLCDSNKQYNAIIKPIKILLNEDITRIIVQINKSFLFLEKKDCIINIVDNIVTKQFVVTKKNTLGKKREIKSKIIKKTFKAISGYSFFVKLASLKKLNKNKEAIIDT